MDKNEQNTVNPTNTGKDQFSTLRSDKMRVNSENAINAKENTSKTREYAEQKYTVNAKESQQDRIDMIENKLEKIIDVLRELTVNKSRTESPANSASSGETCGTYREKKRKAHPIPEGIRLPRGGWIKNPFDEIKFTGKNEDLNPIRFLKKFDNIARFEDVDETDQLYFFGRCMREQASVWFEIHDFNDVHEARNEFTNYFWGETQQAKFREKLYQGKYKPSKNLRMADYALDLARKAKTLEPPMGDAEIIRCVKRHFDKEISREIKIATTKTVSDLIFLLEQLNDERETYAESKTKEKPKEKSDTSKKITRNIKKPGIGKPIGTKNIPVTK